MTRFFPPFAVFVVCSLALASVASADRPSKRQSDKVRGEMLYERHCVQCHGPTGAGNGPATADLVVAIPDLRGKASKENRETNVDLVMKGRGAMPGFFMTLDEHDARRTVRHLERIGPEGAPDFPPEPEPDAEEAADDADDREDDVGPELPDEDETEEAGEPEDDEPEASP